MPWYIHIDTDYAWFVPLAQSKFHKYNGFGMKKLLVLTCACLLFVIVPPAFAHDGDNASPSPVVNISTEQSATINTSQSGANSNNNVNVNNNSNSQSQTQENRQEVTITNNAQPAVLAGISRPGVLPATGPSLLLYSLTLAALPLGLILRRYKAKR